MRPITRKSSAAGDPALSKKPMDRHALSNYYQRRSLAEDDAAYIDDMPTPQPRSATFQEQLPPAVSERLAAQQQAAQPYAELPLSGAERVKQEYAPDETRKRTASEPALPASTSVSTTASADSNATDDSMPQDDFRPPLPASASSSTNSNKREKGKSPWRRSSVRFAKLAKVMPFLPVFDGGKSRFQPVYVGDIARLVELCARGSPEISTVVTGKIIERWLQWALDTFRGASKVAQQSFSGAMELLWDVPDTRAILLVVIVILVVTNIFSLLAVSRNLTHPTTRTGPRERADVSDTLRTILEEMRKAAATTAVLTSTVSEALPPMPTDWRAESAAIQQALDEIEQRVQRLRNLAKSRDEL
ncbi:hypothetical protein AURDEDRAFT_166637 [Auricularia subglabra TFB-10046 SS5]|nr:hypothetical protein AURDEDRAFT_166637 [Auricularia subglabra TFB-10046 SS5]